MKNPFKTLMLSFIILTLAVITTSCKTAEGEKIADYFPIKSDTVYEYESSPGNEANQQTYIGYSNDTKVQRRVKAPGAASTELLEYSNGELRVVYYDPTYYFYENLSNVSPNANVLVLKEPLRQGQKWNFDASTVYEITDMKKKISTKYGVFEAMEVTGTISASSQFGEMTQKEYYVKDIGLVMAEYTYQQTDTTKIELTKVTESTGVQLPFNLYYPNIEKNQLELVESNFVLRTNLDFRKMIEDKLKSTEGFSSGVIPLFSPNTKINSLEVNRAEKIDDTRFEAVLFINLSSEFKENLTRAEVPIINCLTDTLGNLYDVDSVQISIDNTAYTKGANELGRFSVVKSTSEVELNLKNNE